MTTINKETAVAVLRYLASWDNHAVSTVRMRTLVPPQRKRDHPPKHDTARARAFLHKLRDVGLVEGQAGRDGGIRWWKITEAGREFVKTHG